MRRTNGRSPLDAFKLFFVINLLLAAGGLGVTGFILYWAYRVAEKYVNG